jgi:hypothetical protein
MSFGPIIESLQPNGTVCISVEGNLAVQLLEGDPAAGPRMAVQSDVQLRVNRLGSTLHVEPKARKVTHSSAPTGAALSGSGMLVVGWVPRVPAVQQPGSGTLLRVSAHLRVIVLKAAAVEAGDAVHEAINFVDRRVSVSR